MKGKFLAFFEVIQPGIQINLARVKRPLFKSFLDVLSLSSRKVHVFFLLLAVRYL